MSGFGKENKYNFDVISTIAKILEQNPQIVQGRIELFTEIYYPIALLEIDMLETTFEDFDIIQESVLKFVQSGIRSAAEISCLMGLSVNYIQKTMNLLMGYGFINTEGLTQLGVKSLETGKKQITNPVKQRFKADALTGELLKVTIQPNDADLIDKNNLGMTIPHMTHIPGISVESVNQQLKQSDLTVYKRYQGDILNANVDEVNDVRCIGLEYIKAYMVKMQAVDSPFIISYRYDPSEKKFANRYRWRPIKMPCEKAYTEYGFDREIECYSDGAMNAINNLYRLICKSMVSTEDGFDTVDESFVRKKLERIHPLNYERTDISIGRIVDGIPEQISIYVNNDSFTIWNQFVLDFLEGFNFVNGYLYTNTNLNGLFIRVESQNSVIRRVSKEYKRALRHSNSKKLKAYIRERLFNYGQNSNQYMESAAKNIDLEDIIKVIEEYKREDDENLN